MKFGAVQEPSSKRNATGHAGAGSSGRACQCWVAHKVPTPAIALSQGFRCFRGGRADMSFEARRARELRDGEHLTVEHCPGLRLAAAKSAQTWSYRPKSPSEWRLKQVRPGAWPAVSISAQRATWAHGLASGLLPPAARNGWGEVFRSRLRSQGGKFGGENIEHRPGPALPRSGRTGGTDATAASLSRIVGDVQSPCIRLRSHDVVLRA